MNPSRARKATLDMFALPDHNYSQSQSQSQAQSQADAQLSAQQQQHYQIPPRRRPRVPAPATATAIRADPLEESTAAQPTVCPTVRAAVPGDVRTRPGGAYADAPRRYGDAPEQLLRFSSLGDVYHHGPMRLTCDFLAEPAYLRDVDLVFSSQGFYDLR